MSQQVASPLQSANRKRSLRASVGIFGAGVIALAVSACGGVDQANAYTDALNSIQVKINSVVSATSSPEAYEAALNQNLPAIQTDLQQLQAAQGNLSGDSQTIAQKCTTDVQQIVTGLQSLETAVKAKNEAGVEAARTTTNTEIDSLKSCIDEWNTNNGKG